MIFRLLVGYFILESISILLALSVANLAQQQGNFVIYVIGVLIGWASGYFIGKWAWKFIDSYLLARSQKTLSNIKDWELFGPRPIRWLIFIFFFFFIFPNPLSASQFVLMAFSFVDGILCGIVVMYFLYLSFRVFLREREIGKTIAIQINK